MDTVCSIDNCAGCGACLDVCPKKAIQIHDNIKSFNAIIDKNKCIDCNACHTVCQANGYSDFCTPVSWFQGWSEDSKSRLLSSSGGLGFEIEKAFLSTGHVWSCKYFDGSFCFKEVSSVQDLESFRGSKYVKSNPIGIYKIIKSQLNDSKVLFLGLPCQVAALKKYVGEHLLKKLYTVDLICHGTPSFKLLNKFLIQEDTLSYDIGEISFREKNRYGIRSNNESYLNKSVTDNYTLAFLMGLSYTENCYNCSYAKMERVADVTLGDSWGTELSQKEIDRGISLVLIMTEKGKDLIERANVNLNPVNLEVAIKNNKQLIYPTKRPSQRTTFFKHIMSGMDFNNAFRKSCPNIWIKQRIKSIYNFVKK